MQWVRRGRSRFRRHWIVSVVGVLVVAAGIGGWLALRPTGATAATITSTVTSQSFSTTVSATGTINPAKQDALSFPAGGTVTSVAVAEGDHVTKGEVLARMTSDSLVATRDAASATLDAAEAQRTEDEDADASDTQLASDTAQVASARTSLTSAQGDVDDATLTAPFTGTVSAVAVSSGDSTGTGSGGAVAGSGTQDAETSTSAAITVISTSSYVVDATVGSSDVARLKKGMQAEITPTGASRAVYGVVSGVGVVANSTGTDSTSSAAAFPVTIRVTGATKGLYAGSSAGVVITVKKVTGVLSVPTRAVSSSNGATYVTAVVDGKGVRTPITVGQTYGAQTEVTKGLSAGDVVRITGFTAPGGAGGTNRRQGGQAGFPGGGTGGGNGGFGGFGGGQQ